MTHENFPGWAWDGSTRLTRTADGLHLHACCGWPPREWILTRTEHAPDGESLGRWPIERDLGQFMNLDNLITQIDDRWPANLHCLPFQPMPS